MPCALIYIQRPIDSYFESRDYGIANLLHDNKWHSYTPFGDVRSGELYLYRASNTLIQIVQQVQLTVENDRVPPYYEVWATRLKNMQPIVDGDRFAIWLTTQANPSLQHTYVQIRLVQGYAGFAAHPGDEWRSDRVDALLTPSTVAVTGMNSLFDVRRMPFSYGERDEWRTVMLDRPSDELVRETGLHFLQWVIDRDPLYADADASDKELLRSLLEGTKASLSRQKARAAAKRYRGFAWVGWLPLLIAIILVGVALLYFLGYLSFLPPLPAR